VASNAISAGLRKGWHSPEDYARFGRTRRTQDEISFRGPPPSSPHIRSARRRQGGQGLRSTDFEVTEASYRGACVALVLVVVIMNDWMPVQLWPRPGSQQDVCADVGENGHAPRARSASVESSLVAYRVQAADVLTTTRARRGAFQVVWARRLPRRYRTFGRSGHFKSHRSCRPCASRLGQSPFSCSLHFIMFALRPYFSMSLRTL
jgi:hypothetical protein